MTVEECNAQVRNEILEIVTTCREERPGTLYCSCGKIMSEIQQEVKSHVLKDATAHVDNMLILQDYFGQLVLRDAEEAARQNRKRDIRQVRIGNAANCWDSHAAPIAGPRRHGIGGNVIGGMNGKGV